MKTEYPRGLKQGEYIQEVSLKYQSLYPQFAQEHVDVIVKKVVELIFATIDFEKESTILQRNYAEQLRSVVEDEEVEFKNLSLSTIRAIYSLQKGYENSVKKNFLEKEMVFPEENKKEFLDFVSKMTSECILEITNASFAMTSFEEKKKYEDFLKSLEKKDSKPFVSSSFVEKVCGSKRPMKEVSENQKKKRVLSWSK